MTNARADFKNSKFNHNDGQNNNKYGGKNSAGAAVTVYPTDDAAGFLQIASECNFTNCSFVKNSAAYGAAVFVQSRVNKSAQMAFDSCVFEANAANIYGGAVAIEGHSNVSFIRSHFNRNQV